MTERLGSRLGSRLGLYSRTLISTWVLLGLFQGCGSEEGADASGDPDEQEPDEQEPDEPMCEASNEEEAACSDGEDDDCDGFVDCLDSECDGESCGDGLSCLGGACRKPCEAGDEDCVPELPPFENVQVTVRGDTAIIEFEPILGALDYRIYPEPDPADWLIGEDGEVGVKDAIYRCAGDRVFQAREHDEANLFECSLSGCDNILHDYVRTEDEALLGYVYVSPGAGRVPVYRVANPNGGGGFRNSDWLAPIYPEANSADYVTDPEARAELLAAGWRDDGIAFYTAEDADKTVYRIHYTEESEWQGDNVVFLFTDGPEHDARSQHPESDIVDFGPRFQIHAEQEPGSVPLYRVTYPCTFDVLAAGEARFDLVLHQGERPITALAWPGIEEDTRFIIEALDEGCPFPGGYIAYEHKDADVDATSGEPFNYPSITLDEARLSSGEVFINGQHDPENRPKPIARSYVDVTPEPHPEMDFLETFDEDADWEPFEYWRDNNGFVFRNEKWAVDTNGCTSNFTFGPLLGQFVLGFADGGSSCNVSITPKQVETAVEPDSFLHVRMSTDVPSTNRRYPQIMLTTVPLADDPVPEETNVWEVPIHNRLGTFPFDRAGEDGEEGTDDDDPPEGGRTIVVQPFGGYQETQIEFCDTRGWGVSQQCDRANVYGHHAGDYTEEWEESWTPVPVQGAVAGYDRPVQWDVYASTDRVYVFMDGKPAACANLPEGRMPEGPVTVAYRAVLYHCGIDETVTPEDTGHRYERNYSLCHSDHHMDDFGIDRSVPEPAWDESVMPCGDRWYGGT